MMLRRRSWIGRVIRAPWLAWQLWKIHHRAPVRWRIRPPSFVNLSAIPKMVEGHLLSDVIAINASIDIVMGEIDR